MKSPRALFAPACASLLALSLATPSAAQFDVPANYATIQAAVSAAPSGATIHVAAGIYAEQVLIDTKDLTLIGAAGAVVVSPPGGLVQTVLPFRPYQPLWTIRLCDVSIRGFTFDGQRLGDQFLGGHIGCFFFGANGDVRNCHFTGFRQAILGTTSQDRGLSANNPEELGTPVRQIEIHDNTFADNRYSIHLVGDDVLPFANVLRLKVSVVHNTVTGIGPTAEGAQFGIMLHSDSGGSVIGNTVTDHLNLVTTTFGSTGIVGGLPFIPGLLLTQPTQMATYANNTLINNRFGFTSLATDGIQVVHNTIVGSGTTLPSGEGGGIIVSGHADRVTNNDISNVPGGFGIALLGTETFFGFFGVASDASVTANRISGALTPIFEGVGVTGTVQRGNQITP